jgi:hypothetical protein
VALQLQPLGSRLAVLQRVLLLLVVLPLLVQSLLVEQRQLAALQLVWLLLAALPLPAGLQGLVLWPRAALQQVLQQLALRLQLAAALQRVL